MTIPQVKSTLWTLVIILAGIPLLSCYLLYQNGELTTWDMLPHALGHASFAAFWTAIGWIFFKSPFSPQLTELLVTKTKGGETETTKVSLTEPVATKELPK